MVNLLLACLLPLLSSQATPNTTSTPTQPPLVLQTGPQRRGSIPSQTVRVGTEESYTIAVNDYFYEPNKGSLAITAIYPLAGGDIANYSWLDFYEQDSSLLMKPIAEEDKGDYHFRLIANNSIGQHTSQLMTIHVVDKAASFNTTIDNNATSYEWVIPAIITVWTLPAYLWYFLIDMKRKKQEAIEANAYNDYANGKALDQVIEDIGHGNDAYYFKCCGGYACYKIKGYYIEKIKAKVSTKLYFMLKETIDWRENTDGLYELNEQTRAFFVLATNINEAALAKIEQMSVPCRRHKAEKLKQVYFPVLLRKKKRIRKKTNFTTLSTITEALNDSDDETAMLNDTSV